MSIVTTCRHCGAAFEPTLRMRVSSERRLCPACRHAVPPNVRYLPQRPARAAGPRVDRSPLDYGDDPA